MTLFDYLKENLKPIQEAYIAGILSERERKNLELNGEVIRAEMGQQLENEYEDK
jgi:RNA:NAD 2'-phosphotransferase (TPT1/KptA family)